MCLFRAPKMTSLPIPPAIAPRVPTDTSLPTKKEVVDPDTKAEVTYGTGKKKAAPSAGKRTGADQLEIDLNVGSTTGAQTGGANVK
tara:strand:+ start:71 stop:328 length:258 start_codon:yes stop_codon:yes gene_type:complete